MALARARDWFADPEVQTIASDPYPVGSNQNLIYDKKVTGFTVGDALRDYVEWKRIAAARSHFETVLSLINCHLIPRLGDDLVETFTNRKLTAFCRDVLETPPKRGNQPLGPRVRIEDLDSEALRKRKKTVNTLIGILRLAFRIAWENGETDSDRAWRSLRRLPNFDAPRQIFLTRDQCRALLANCDDDLANLVRGALYTGCRVGELSNLRVKDVGTDVFGIYVAPSKSYRGRYVYLPEEGMSFFLDQCDGKEPDDGVFRMNSGRTWYGNHKHAFRKAVQSAGLPDAFVFHGLRHTYASQLVQAGAPLAIVARQLGHASTDTVSRTYGHLSCVAIEDELARRFVTLEVRPLLNREAIRKLRASLQDHDPTIAKHGHWPRSNFTTFREEWLATLVPN